MASRGSSKLSVRYLDEKILLSDDEAWTYLRIPLIPYEFLSATARKDIAIRVSMSLAQLVTNNQTAVDVHLLVTHKLFDVEEWETALANRVSHNRPTPGWNSYLNRMADHVDYIGFNRKEVYLGVKLGPRKGKGSVGQGESTKTTLLDMIKPITKLVGFVEEKAGIEDITVPEYEVKEWHKRAEDVHRTMANSAVRAVPASADEVAWLIAKPLWPLPMQQPKPTASGNKVWGAGTLRQLAEGVVTNHYRFLEIDQIGESGEPEKGFLAVLAVSRFPDVLYFPEQEPWMHFAENLLLPDVPDWSTRMSIVPPMKVQKDVGKKLADAKDQAQHIAETGAGVPMKIREQLEVATVLEYQIDKERNPWAYARHRVLVTGRTEEEVTANARTIIEKYRELNIDVVWPSGDQLNLFLEAMPGDKVRSTAYHQRQEINVISGGMPTASSDVGDRIEGKGERQKGWMGPYLGITVSRVLQPVFFSPHTAMARNNPPGIAITGAPGGGKALALTTPIPTPCGWSTMESLNVGDKVYDEKGKPCTVIGKTEVLSDRECFEVCFSDGSRKHGIIADAQHMWPLTDGSTVTTQELFDEGPYKWGEYDGSSLDPETQEKVLHRITCVRPVVSVPVQCIEVDSPSRLYLAGEGKAPTHNSFLAFTLAYQMAVSGVWTIYIDPKADAKPMGLLPGLGNPKVFDLKNGNDGMLDPFSLGATKGETTLLALETLRLLLGGNVSEEREEALLTAVEAASKSANPSLNAVVDYLLANSESTSARNLGTVLKTIRELPFARLCFSSTGGNQLRPEDGLTVVTLLGLELPSALTTSDDYSYENRLAVAVMYLLTRYARQLMLNMDKSHPKAICIDEAWAITSTPQGAKLIPEIARMGRSHNTALVLVSQNAKDLMEEAVTNSISTKFAFRSAIPAEVDSVLELFGLSKEEGFQSYIRNLPNGQCLMQDVDGRVAQIHVDDWNKQLKEAFDTNPETRGKKTSK